MMDSSEKSVLSEPADGVLCFPVRHHSPACSYFLRQMILKYSPDCILIEGPEDADFLTGYIAGSGVVPPFAVYCSFDDTKAQVSQNKEKYRAYYPMLRFSPEYIALKTASDKKIPVHFIDMPYALQLVNGLSSSKCCHFGEDICEEYYEEAARRSGCRSFDEFWENGFEISGLTKTCGEFTDSLIMLGSYLREIMPVSERDKYREGYMRKNIDLYRKQYKRIMVVTGAYHVPGLSSVNDVFTFRSYSTENSRVYLMPYTYEETDSRSGYSAGIPFPAFYDCVWDKLDKGSHEAYGETVLQMIMKTAGYQGLKHNISIPDMTQALYMANELSHLRGRKQPGVYELIDGVKSSFIKGAIDKISPDELDILFKILTGMKAGSINISDKKTELVPPCVDDFRTQCAKYRISTKSVLRQNITLDIVKNEKHFEKSCFLHRMAWLGTKFCSCTKGPDYIANRDTALIREHWEVRYSSQVITALTDLSVYGVTVKGICLNKLKNDFMSVKSAEEAGKSLAVSYVLGLSQTARVYHTDLSEKIRNDCDFISQCRFMITVNRLLILQKLSLSQYPEWILSLLGISFMTAAGRITEIRNVSDDRTVEICDGLRLMYSLSSDFPDVCQQTELTDNLHKVLDLPDIKACIYGVCLSLYFRLSAISEENYCDTVSEYIITANASDAADFISGIIQTSRDIVLKKRKVLLSIDKALEYMDSVKFYEVLPVLRRAFTQYLPSETLDLSSQIAEIYNTDTALISKRTDFSLEQITRARKYDEKIYEMMKKWGMNVEQPD